MRLSTGDMTSSKYRKLAHDVRLLARSMSHAPLGRRQRLCRAPMRYVVARLVWGVLACYSVAAQATIERYDLSDTTSKIVIAEERVARQAGHSPLPVALLCFSTADPGYGACARQAVANKDAAGPESEIQLQFVERATREAIILSLKGTKQIGEGGASRSIGLDSLSTDSSATQVLSYSVFIPAEQLASIPFGGIWEAHLALEALASDDTRSRLDMPITLQVTDRRNASITFPEEGAVPFVTFTLRPESSGSMAASETVQACLYDGYSLHSSAYKISLTDQDDPGARSFHLRHVQRDGSDLSGQLEYRVRISQPGAGHMPDRAVEAGVAVMLSGIDGKEGALTSLTRVRGRSLPCARWAIALDVVPFAISEKRAGDYEGTLSITFTPTTETGG